MNSSSRKRMILTNKVANHVERWEEVVNNDGENIID